MHKVDQDCIKVVEGGTSLNIKAELLLKVPAKVDLEKQGGGGGGREGGREGGRQREGEYGA